MFTIIINDLNKYEWLRVNGATLPDGAESSKRGRNLRTANQGFADFLNDNGISFSVVEQKIITTSTGRRELLWWPVSWTPTPKKFVWNGVVRESTFAPAVLNILNHVHSGWM